MNNKPALISLTFSLVTVAATNATAQSTDTARLGTVVVSASKVPRPAATLSQAGTVLSGDDLRARGVVRVSDALREVPGASLVQSGSYGAITSLFLRGGESRYTKVLIDGVAVNSPGGSFDFSHLTTDNIDRIEIVRGPASVLYGADAVTGIVQIFTRRGSDQGRMSFGGRGGTYRSLDLDADAVGSTPLGGISLGAAHHSTDGIIPFNNAYRNGTLSSALTLAQSAAGDARVTARYTTAEFHYPTDFTGAPVDTNSYRVQHRLTVGLDAGRSLTPNIEARLLAGNNDVWDLSEDIAVPFGGTAPQHSAFRSRGYRRNVEGRLGFTLPTDATVTVGGTYEQEPEKSRSAEIGLASNFHPEVFGLSVGYFNQRFSDLIQFVNGGPPDFLGSFANLTGATSNGYEAELQLTPITNWRGTASYTIVNPRVTNVDPAYQGSSKVGDALIRRPSHSGSAVVSYGRPSNSSFGASVSFVGKRADMDFSQFPSPFVTLPSYTKVDLSAELPLTRVRR